MTESPVAAPRLRLVVARHGNTFEADVVPTRVGARTDLPLTSEGREQGRKLGIHWREAGWLPAGVWCGPLKRTRQTAEAALKELALDMTPQVDERFREIDYGPDENQPEYLVRLRLGRAQAGREATDADADAAGHKIVKAWDLKGEVPNGWVVDPQALSTMWQTFAAECSRHANGKTFIVFTSNGIARFAPALADGGMEAFLKDHPRGPKLSTGAYGVFELDGEDKWHCTGWNIRPDAQES